jgi:hypothetical protein
MNSREPPLERRATDRVRIPVDAICVGCVRTRAKHVRPEEMSQDADVDPAALEATDLTSFKHVCHPCGSATWWNPVAVLSGLLEKWGESA